MNLLPYKSVWTNVIVTVSVLLFVVLMPVIDQRVCARWHISPQLGTGTSSHDRRFLRLRQLVLYVTFALYSAAVAYMVFFSRTAADDYRVNAELFGNLSHSIHIDLGFLEFLQSIYEEGFFEAFRHIQIMSLKDVAQWYLNIMLFVPMGYLLPYVFPWFRAKVRTRPVVASFFILLFIENVQLVSKLGFYDVDDLAANTLGGLVGRTFFLVFAYVITNPDWKRSFRSLRRWSKDVRNHALSPFWRTIDISRTTLLGTDEDAIWGFYVDKLGFRLIGQVVPLDSPGTTLLLELGQTQVEIRCTNQPGELGEQYLNLTSKDLVKAKASLEAHGIEVGPIENDAFPGMRRMSFDGPDNVRITMVERFVK